MYLQRYLDLSSLISKKSFFLFGPRSTGKTSLIKAQLGEKALVIDLLRSDVLLTLMSAPWEIESIINKRSANQIYVVIDEVQKFPALLNEVHRLIEEKKIHFILTGSSARKLRRGEVNLLGGRAWQAELLPLIKKEIPNFSLERYLQVGGLPNVYLSAEWREELVAYGNLYLTQEVYAESLVKKIQPFSKFLRIAALTSGKLLNFTEVGNDAGVSSATIREYYHILEDTLLGTIIEPWSHHTKRKAVSTAKFYFFDIGVRNHFANIHAIVSGTDTFGQAFEHFIYQEIRAYLSYTRKRSPLTFWRTQLGHEVDFMIGDNLAIEIKAAQTVTFKHAKGLRLLQQEKICKKHLLVSLDRINREDGGIEIICYSDFLDLLWQGEYDQFMA